MKRNDNSTANMYARAKQYAWQHGALCRSRVNVLNQQRRSNVEVNSQGERYSVTMFTIFGYELNSNIESIFIKNGEIFSSFDCLFPQKQMNFNEVNCQNLRQLLYYYVMTGQLF